MVVTRWAPRPINEFREFRGFRRLPRPLGVFSPFYGNPASAPAPAPAPRGEWPIPLDVERGEGQFIVRANLPGFAPDDLSVTIAAGVLTIQAGRAEEAEPAEGDFVIRERRAGVFRRSLRLPEAVDAGQAQSTSEHGVLTVTLPLAEARQPRQLKVAAPANG